MIRIIAPLFVMAALASPALAQDDDVAKLKKAIMDKVKARLEVEHRKILERVSQIIDEELSGRGPQSKPPENETDRKIAELMKRLDDLDKAKRELKREIERLKEDLGGKGGDSEDRIKADAKTKGPQDPQEAQDLFDEANADHTAKNFDDSIRKFKYIYYQFPGVNVGATAAYNVSCGYSLRGEKAKACEWLAISFKAGFNQYDHVRKDSDLDNIRNEKKYQELMSDK